MIIFEGGWNNTQIGLTSQKRIATAALANAAVATTIINAAANEIVRTGGSQGWFQTFANAVLCPADGSADLDAHVLKGLHQEEGSVFDADVHLTVRCLKKTFHLYVTAEDPALGVNHYTLRPSSLSFIDNGSRFVEDISGLAGIASVPVSKR